jgi:N-acetylneuraminic acid mutarotase
MKKKFTSQSARVLVALLVCPAAGLILAGTVPAFFRSSVPSQLSQRTLTFAERVSYQGAIEDVYWRHRIWPKENPNPKPSLDAVMSHAQLENKVAGYLRDSLVLEDYWQKPITAQQLQAEMDRIARDTKQPEVLRELFEALGNDPAVIAECLARPILAERLIADLPVQDQTRHVGSPQTDALRAMSVATTLGQVVYTLPEITDAGGLPCTDDTWTATTTANAPVGRVDHTAVWTGSEMIVWGGTPDGHNYPNTGGRYDPSTDSWAATSLTNAPTGRYGHTAVWTGSEMIIWGGFGNTGGKYNPATNSWAATSTTNAPTERHDHTAVWTGSEMIVWGGLPGSGGYANTGGKYAPTTDTWTVTTTINAPDARWGHTAVWTGSEMIVWGGHVYLNSVDTYSRTGGRYDPSTDSWTATSMTRAPTRRSNHTAVWTGSEMIVWGGIGDSGTVSDGGRYFPSTNSWTATSLTNAPSPRWLHTAVWTGSKMIIWGGEFRANTGGRYDPSTDSWTATSTTNAPPGYVHHTAVWTGSEMIVWGGQVLSGLPTNRGRRYCAPGLPAQLGNISTRGFVQTGDNVMIGGFIVQGSAPTKVIIRAIGPELGGPPYDIPNAMTNPTLELHNGAGALIASNDNWQQTIIGGIITSDQVRDIRNSGYVPADGRESAIIAELPAGNYTAIVRGVNNTTGVALVEVYDVGPSDDSVLGNISTRGFVQTGDNVMIGGFIVEGNSSKRVIVRAIGPELTQHGVPNPLADPTLELHNAAGALIAHNDNWMTTILGGIITRDQVQDIRNSGHAPTDATESAIIATLAPGNYTAIVRGVNATTGVGLVEVYDLD